MSGAYCSVVQFSRSYVVPGANYLAQLFYRANGMMCKQNYPGIDGLEPMLMLHSNSELTLGDIALTPDKFSHCSYQDKLYAESPGKANYWCFTHSMQEQSILSADDPVNKNHVYLSIVMDMGSTKDKNPLVYRFPSTDPRQISIAVRGLRPSHIFSDLPSNEKNELDHQFLLLVTSHADEARPP